MMPNRWIVLSTTSAYAALTLGIQIVGLLWLPPIEFGSFSVQYLIFALASSMVLSVVSEAWVRARAPDGVLTPWSTYANVTAYVALAFGILTVIVSFVVPTLRGVSVTGALAVACATYRSGVRYYQVYNGWILRTIVPEVVGLFTFLLAIMFSAQILNGALNRFVLAWSISATATAVLSGLPRPQSPVVVSSWIRMHIKEIKTLFGESILMDAGAIGTPYAMAPVLGLVGFGTYRAVSNVAAPVRIILNPLRPNLASMPLSRLMERKRLALVLGISAIFGFLAFVGLQLVALVPGGVGALSSVVEYSVPTSLFTFGSFVGHYFYVLARANSPQKDMFVGRICQTILAIAFPLVGVFVGGLGAGIWGLTLSTLLSAGVWSRLVVTRAHTSGGLL